MTADQEDVACWNGELLGQGKVSLFALGCGSEHKGAAVPLGAAATREHTAILLPHEFASFLKVHAENVVVCFDAAQLHWLLDGYLHATDDKAGLSALWELSGSNRLIDVSIMDRHVRRYHCRQELNEPSLGRLAADYLNAPLLHDDLGQLVREVWSKAAQHGDDAPLKPLIVVAKSLLAIYQALWTQSKRMIALLDENRLRHAPPPDQEPDELMIQASIAIGQLTAAWVNNNPAPVSQRARWVDTRPGAAFGPLGVGVDVQSAIAFARPGGHPLTIDPVQKLAARDKASRDYQAACESLRGSDAEKCFYWDQNKRQIDRDEHGQPRTKSKALKTWLRQHAGRLHDVNNLPADTPLTSGQGRWYDPDSWGVWTRCDKLLAAWRQLHQACRAEKVIQADGSVQPRVGCPEFDALLSLGIPHFRLPAGHVFLVGTLRDLTIRSFAAVCDQAKHSFRGRLKDYFFARFDDPVPKIANELFARKALLKVTEDFPQEELEQQFAELKERYPLQYARELLIARALLEVLPLGLHEEQMSWLLEHQYRLNLSAADVALNMQLLKEHVVYELYDFLQVNLFIRLTDVLGRPVGSIPHQLISQNSDLFFDAEIQKDLLSEGKRGRFWRFISEYRRKNPLTTGISDEEIVDCVLKHRLRTLAGRPIPPYYAAAAKRQQVLDASDDAMKLVAYAMVARGHQVAAVWGNVFLLTVAESEATEELRQTIREVARHAQGPLLRQLAAPCDAHYHDPAAVSRRPSCDEMSASPLGTSHRIC